LKKYFIIIVALICIISSKYCYSQKKYLIGSFWGFPSAGGFGYGNLGFEYQQKNYNNAWQISINVSAGAIATDVGNTNRKWFTVDKLKSIKSSFSDKNSFFYSLFFEIGSRKTSGGWWRSFSDTMLNRIDAFEINPGIGLGTNIKLFKKIHLQLIAAPKAIFAFHKDKYQDLLNKNYFYKKYADFNIGYRIAANFCFQL